MKFGVNMFYRPLCSVIFGTFFLSGALHASEMIEIAPFRVAGYTDKFAKGFDVNIQMKIMGSGQFTKATMTIQQLPGKPTKRLGGDWIGVSLTGRTVIEKEKLAVRYLDLYDEKTLQLQYSIDLSDQSISSYQWTNVPKSMWLGQKIKVGAVVEKDSSGKTLASGDVDFILSRVGDGFEFCTVEIVKNTESKEVEITKDCDLFDSSKRIVGTSIEVKLGSQSITTGTGKVQVN
jgi:hypothetical protein